MNSTRIIFTEPQPGEFTTDTQARRSCTNTYHRQIDTDQTEACIVHRFIRANLCDPWSTCFRILVPCEDLER